MGNEVDELTVSFSKVIFEKLYLIKTFVQKLALDKCGIHSFLPKITLSDTG